MFIVHRSNKKQSRDSNNLFYDKLKYQPPYSGFQGIVHKPCASEWHELLPGIYILRK